jgi:acetyl-CoA synthetase
VGWVTGHSYIVYGPLCQWRHHSDVRGRAHLPDASALLAGVDKHQVNIFYTAPTAIRALMREGEQAGRSGLSRQPAPARFGRRTDQSGSLGVVSPRMVGKGRCPIVDTWWQTETGGILITPLPGATALKARFATRRSSACSRRWSTNGQHAGGAGEGNLVIAALLAGQMRTVYGDHERFVETYFSTYPGYVLHRRRRAPRRGRLLLDHRPGG